MFLIALAVLGLGAGGFVLAAIHADRVSAWIRALPSRLRRRGWGLLLVPLAVQYALLTTQRETALAEVMAAVVIVTFAPYVATKAGLMGLTRNAAHAHRWDRIRINGLNIGWTDTEGEDETQRRFHGAGDDWREKAGASLPMGKLGQPDEIADFVVFLLSDRSGVVTGSVIDWDQNVLGGFD